MYFTGPPIFVIVTCYLSVVLELVEFGSLGHVAGCTRNNTGV